MMVKDCDKIPAAPLLEYVERIGGANRLAGMGVWDRGEKSIDGGTGDQETVDRDFTEAARYLRLDSLLREAKERGWVSLFRADAICCDFFGVHPMQVYGMEWFDFGAELEPKDERWVERWTEGISTKASSAVLNVDKVREMRRLSAEEGVSYAELGRRFGVSARSATDAVSNRTWKEAAA